jgi:hypothetical protein
MPTCVNNYGFVYCQDEPDRCKSIDVHKFSGVRFFYLFFYFVGQYELNIALQVLDLFEKVTNFNNELFLSPLCVKEKYFRFFVTAKANVQHVLMK